MQIKGKRLTNPHSARWLLRRRSVSEQHGRPDCTYPAKITRWEKRRAHFGLLQELAAQHAERKRVV
jgi:hypothetical protein